MDVGLPFRMRIEHWELNIGQMLPSLHSTKLFLREQILGSIHAGNLGEITGKKNPVATERRKRNHRFGLTIFPDALSPHVCREANTTQRANHIPPDINLPPAPAEAC